MPADPSSVPPVLSFCLRCLSVGGLPIIRAYPEYSMVIASCAYGRVPLKTQQFYLPRHLVEALKGTSDDLVVLFSYYGHLCDLVCTLRNWNLYVPPTKRLSDPMRRYAEYLKNYARMVSCPCP